MVDMKQPGQAGQAPALEIAPEVAAYNLGRNECVRLQREERRVLGAIIILVNLGLAGIGNHWRAGVWLIFAAVMLAALRLVRGERIDPFVVPFRIVRAEEQNSTNDPPASSSSGAIGR